MGNPVAETSCPPERGQVLISVAVGTTRRCKKWGNASPPSLAWPSSAQVGRERGGAGGREMKVHAQLITDACKQVGLLLCPLESGAECPPPTPSGTASFCF